MGLARLQGQGAWRGPLPRKDSAGPGDGDAAGRGLLCPPISSEQGQPLQLGLRGTDEGGEGSDLEGAKEGRLPVSPLERQVGIHTRPGAAPSSALVRDVGDTGALVLSLNLCCCQARVLSSVNGALTTG